jgi:hypothetical protein
MGALPNTFDSSRRPSAPCEAPVMLDAGYFWCTSHSTEVSPEELILDDLVSPILPGTGVDIYFELAGLIPIETRAVVTQSEGHRATLRFLDLDANAVRALEGYVSGNFLSSSSTRIRKRPSID